MAVMADLVGPCLGIRGQEQPARPQRRAHRREVQRGVVVVGADIGHRPAAARHRAGVAICLRRGAGLAHHHVAMRPGSAGAVIDLQHVVGRGFELHEQVPAHEAVRLDLLGDAHQQPGAVAAPEIDGHAFKVAALGVRFHPRNAQVVAVAPWMHPAGVQRHLRRVFPVLRPGPVGGDQVVGADVLVFRHMRRGPRVIDGVERKRRLHPAALVHEIDVAGLVMHPEAVDQRRVPVAGARRRPAGIAAEGTAPPHAHPRALGARHGGIAFFQRLQVGEVIGPDLLEADPRADAIPVARHDRGAEIRGRQPGQVRDQRLVGLFRALVLVDQAVQHRGDGFLAFLGLERPQALVADPEHRLGVIGARGRAHPALAVGAVGQEALAPGVLAGVVGFLVPQRPGDIAPGAGLLARRPAGLGRAAEMLVRVIARIDGADVEGQLIHHPVHAQGAERVADRLQPRPVGHLHLGIVGGGEQLILAAHQRGAGLKRQAGARDRVRVGGHAPVAIDHAAAVIVQAQRDALRLGPAAAGLEEGAVVLVQRVGVGVILPVVGPDHHVGGGVAQLGLHLLLGQVGRVVVAHDLGEVPPGLAHVHGAQGLDRGLGGGVAQLDLILEVEPREIARRGAAIGRDRAYEFLKRGLEFGVPGRVDRAGVIAVLGQLVAEPCVRGLVLGRDAGRQVHVAFQLRLGQQGAGFQHQAGLLGLGVIARIVGGEGLVMGVEADLRMLGAQRQALGLARRGAHLDLDAVGHVPGGDFVAAQGVLHALGVFAVPGHVMFAIGHLRLGQGRDEHDAAGAVLDAVEAAFELAPRIQHLPLDLEAGVLQLRLQGHDLGGVGRAAIEELLLHVRRPGGIVDHGAVHLAVDHAGAVLAVPDQLLLALFQLIGQFQRGFGLAGHGLQGRGEAFAEHHHALGVGHLDGGALLVVGIGPLDLGFGRFLQHRPGARPDRRRRFGLFHLPGGPEGFEHDLRAVRVRQVRLVIGHLHRVGRERHVHMALVLVLELDRQHALFGGALALPLDRLVDMGLGLQPVLGIDRLLLKLALVIDALAVAPVGAVAIVRAEHVHAQLVGHVLDAEQLIPDLAILDLGDEPLVELDHPDRGRRLQRLHLHRVGLFGVEILGLVDLGDAQFALGVLVGGEGDVLGMRAHLRVVQVLQLHADGFEDGVDHLDRPVGAPVEARDHLPVDIRAGVVRQLGQGVALAHLGSLFGRLEDHRHGLKTSCKSRDMTKFIRMSVRRIHRPVHPWPRSPR